MWNAKGTEDEMKRFFERIGRVSDVYVGAEFGGLGSAKRRAFRRALPGWKFVNRRSDNPVVIAYNPKRVETLAEGEHFLTPRTYVGPAGAGPRTLREKKAPFAQFRLLGTRRKFWLVGSHDAPSIYIDKRDELHEKQQEEKLKLLKGLRGNKLSVGDYNAGWKHPNMRPWKRAGFVCDNPNVNTHDRTRAIIDLFLRKALRMRPVQKTVIQGPVEWDHNAVNIVYRFI